MTDKQDLRKIKYKQNRNYNYYNCYNHFMTPLILSGQPGEQDIVSEWQWDQLGHVQIFTSPQTDNHASIPPLSILQAGCPSCRPTNSIKAPKTKVTFSHTTF